MSLRTSKVAVASRTAVRRLGLTPLLRKLVMGSGYETAFHEAIIGNIRPGDVIWDIGANVGLYTKEFATRAGETGRVYAFEPSPDNFETLKAAITGESNATAINLALGSSEGRLHFLQGDDDIGATSRVVESGGIEVEVARPSTLVANGTCGAPTFAKIDVEGFELEVLNGMGDMLADPGLRVLCIEVHFGLLAERGQAGAPKQIEAMLAGHGFKVAWPDPSHIVATRG